MKNAALYFFSGSGNSQFLTQKVADKLNEKEINSKIINIEDNITDNDCDLAGFVLPVYGFGLPANVVSFINNLPKVQNKKAFVLLTPAGHEGIAIIQANYLLKRKGYDVVLADKILMPDSWILVMNGPTEEKFNEASQKADVALTEKIDFLFSDERKVKIANPILLLILGYIQLIFAFLGRFQSGKMFTTNSNCKGCSICYKRCPSNTIKWRNNKPYWSWTCIGCFRCINACPQDAIEISNFALLGVALIFITGSSLLSLLPAKILSIVLLIPFSKTIFVIGFSLVYLHLINKMHFKNLLPAWYITRTRRRYKIPK